MLRFSLVNACRCDCLIFFSNWGYVKILIHLYMNLLKSPERRKYVTSYRLQIQKKTFDVTQSHSYCLSYFVQLLMPHAGAVFLRTPQSPTPVLWVCKKEQVSTFSGIQVYEGQGWNFFPVFIPAKALCCTSCSVVLPVSLFTQAHRYLPLTLVPEVVHSPALLSRAYQFRLGFLHILGLMCVYITDREPVV